MTPKQENIAGQKCAGSDGFASDERGHTSRPHSGFAFSSRIIDAY